MMSPSHCVVWNWDMHLSDVLQYEDDVPEVTNMEHGRLQVDVTNTVSQ